MVDQNLYSFVLSISIKENKQQMENLQQGIEALNVDIGGGEQSDVSYFQNSTHHVIVMTYS